MNLYQRLVKAALAIPNGGVAKDVQVTGGGSYRAVGHGQVVERTRKALLENGVIYFVSSDPASEWGTGTTRNGGETNVFYGVFNVEFVNADEPSERHVVRVVGHGIDSQDKAFAKASSYAKKLALMQALQLFGDDDAIDEEREHAEPVAMQRRQSEPPREITWAQVLNEGKRRGGISEITIRLYLLHKYGLVPGGPRPSRAQLEDAMSFVVAGGILDESQDASAIAKEAMQCGPVDLSLSHARDLLVKMLAGQNAP